MTRALIKQAGLYACLYLMFPAVGAAQSALAPGDLAIIQYRTAKGDSFSFVPLVDILPNTVIKFTDKGWTGSGLSRDESVWPWTAPARGVPRGQVVQVDIGEGLNNKQGDQLIAFQGTVAEPRFLFALSTCPWLIEGNIDPSTSYLPPGLVNGQTALDFKTHRKHGAYNLARTGGFPEDIIRSVSDAAHWRCSHEASGLFRSPSDWTFAVAARPAPVVKPLRLGIARSTSRLIRLPTFDCGQVSAMQGDPTDPASTEGIHFVVAGGNQPRVQVSVTQAPEIGKPYAPPILDMNREEGVYKLKITPSGAGFARITVSANDGTMTNTYELLYASAVRPAGGANPCQHTHSSDASAVVSAGPLHMLVADDEDQYIRLYHRYRSGAPLAQFDVGPYLNLADMKNGDAREVDIEGAAEVGARVYWIGSHGNSRVGRFRSNRSRVFSTDRIGQGVRTKLKFIGHYEGLRDDLLDWDRTNGHGLGVSYLGLAGSAHAAPAGGLEPKRTDGFNIEGLAMQPNSRTDMFLGFRAPLVPPGDRRFALVVPVSNLTEICDSSASPGAASFGAPILLDLEGRGIRSMARNDSNRYIIVAGPQRSSSDPAHDFKLFSWDGCPDSKPTPCDVDIEAAGLAGDIEGVLDVPDDFRSFHLILDQGSKDWYGDGIAAKAHAGPLRQFSSGILDIHENTTSGCRVAHLQGSLPRPLAAE
ncbi:MAG: DUF3616 domain-containing protein [Spartobacteria bacterium]|nr:DUF3616 domain-containing protein [Spartobacteria bacterium]